MNHWLLYFDEIQILDVSSAGLISDVISWFWRMGGVVVATSNKVPRRSISQRSPTGTIGAICGCSEGTVTHGRDEGHSRLEEGFDGGTGVDLLVHETYPARI